MSSARRIIVWATADQQPLISAAVKSAELELMSIGSPRSESASSLAKAMEVERFDDLRQAVQRQDIDLVWLAAAEPIEADVRRLLDELKLPTVCSQPPFTTISELINDPAGASETIFVPLMRRSPGYRAASDVLPQFGQPQCVNVFFRSGPGQGTLLARLYDAVDVINLLCGQIETINAGLAGSLPAVPDMLTDLRGHLTGNLRFKPNRCACIALSDAAGSWFRGVTVLGEEGCLRISDGGFEWIGSDGRIVDRHDATGAITPGELIGAQISRIFDSMDLSDPPPDNIHLLAMCEAARLSCLTGQDEAPAKIIEMLSRP